MNTYYSNGNPDAIIRSGSTIYPNVVWGKNFETGHNVVIRDGTRIGDNVMVGTGTIIEGECIIQEGTRIQSNVFIPRETVIGHHVFIGPGVVMTNDKYPPSPPGKAQRLLGPTICSFVRIGAHATILPGVRIGYGAFVAAGALVTKDVPEHTMAIGNPAVIKDIPEEMKQDD